MHREAVLQFFVPWQFYSSAAQYSVVVGEREESLLENIDGYLDMYGHFIQCYINFLFGLGHLCRRNFG